MQVKTSVQRLSISTSAFFPNPFPKTTKMYHITNLPITNNPKPISMFLSMLQGELNVTIRLVNVHCFSWTIDKFNAEWHFASSFVLSNSVFTLYYVHITPSFNSFCHYYYYSKHYWNEDTLFMSALHTEVYFFHTGSKEDQCKGRENGINCCRVCSHSFYRRVTWHAGFLWFVSNSSRWETNVGKLAQRFRSIILFFSYQEFRKGWLWLLSGSHSCKQEKNGCVFESCFTRILFCLLLKYLHIKDCWTFVYI